MKYDTLAAYTCKCLESFIYVYMYDKRMTRKAEKKGKKKERKNNKRRN